jgi:ferredoxin
MIISVDKNLCIGCGACTSLCPNVFKINENDRKAEVISQEDEECAKNTASSCPVQAISVA